MPHHLATANLPVPTVRVLDHTKLLRVKGTISEVNAAGNKVHDPQEPIFFWYQDTPEGKEINIALYTKPCRWKRCSFCTLPAQSSPIGVSENDIMAQVNKVFNSYNVAQLAQVRRVFVSNNGSVLDPDTLPPQILSNIIHLALARCPQLAILCLETRFDSVTPENIDKLQIGLRGMHYTLFGAGFRSNPNFVKLQFSGGYETQDPYLRNAVLFKGYSEEKVQEFFALCADAVKKTEYPILLDEYVMLKPAAGMTDEEAVAEAVETILHLDRLGKHFNIPVSIRLNPAFAAIGSELHKQFQTHNYTPPTLRAVCQVIEQVRQQDCQIPIFVGLNNEGLVATDEACFGNWDSTDTAYKKALQEWNLHQSYPVLHTAVGLIEEATKPKVCRHCLKEDCTVPEELWETTPVADLFKCLQATFARAVAAEGKLDGSAEAKLSWIKDMCESVHEATIHPPPKSKHDLRQTGLDIMARHVLGIIKTTQTQAEARIESAEFKAQQAMVEASEKLK